MNCRICSQKIPAVIITEHNSICLEKINWKKKLLESDKDLIDLCETAINLKTIYL